VAVSRQTFSNFAPWWPVAWLLTSLVLVAVLSQIESGWFVAAGYVTLNACAVASVALDEPSVRERQLRVVGWCAAAQLPVMLWVVVNGRRQRGQLHSDVLVDQKRRIDSPPHR